MVGELFSSNHPPHPPTSEDDQIAQLRLLRSRRVGPATYRRLISENGSASAALIALPQIAQIRGVHGYQICPVDIAKAEFEAGQKIGAQLIWENDPAYPGSLKDVRDAPPCLWMVGDPTQLEKPCVALVGARNASSNGTRMAKRIAAGLGEAGITVVSGLARGIDTAAHIAALPFGTAAVLAGGVDRIYPDENVHLGRDIGKTGVRVSEQPIGLQAQARDFPKRNRIISGLSQAVVVVEAASKSGTLITAQQALDQGRDVLAVPGHPVDARAAGCNQLIRDGAQLVRGVYDILEILKPNDTSWAKPPAPKKKEPALAEAPTKFVSRPLRSVARLHQKILDRLGPAPTAEDQLGRDLKVAASDVGSALVELELDGAIERQSGGLIVKIPRN